MAAFDKAMSGIPALDQVLEGLRDVLLHHEARLNENAAEREKLDEAVALMEEALAEERRAHLSANEALHESRSAAERTEHQIASIRKISTA